MSEINREEMGKIVIFFENTHTATPRVNKKLLKVQIKCLKFQ